MEFSNIIFISDMDETLFDNQKNISPINRNAILHFQEKGGLFTIATGRSITGFKPYVDVLNIIHPVILYNGSCIYDYQTSKIIWKMELPCASKQYLHQIMTAFPSLGVQIMTKSGIYSLHPTPAYIQFMEREHLPYIKVSDIHEVSGKWLKIEMTSDTVNQQEYDAFLNKSIPPGIRCLTTGAYSRELMNAGASKGSAVIAYKKMFQLEDKTLCCIGDHNNDYEMIQNADIGFAVGNALDKIIRSADFVVRDNEHHAVASAIKVLEDMG